jgi:hypothetical protein
LAFSHEFVPAKRSVDERPPNLDVPVDVSEYRQWWRARQGHRLPKRIHHYLVREDGLVEPVVQNAVPVVFLPLIPERVRFDENLSVAGLFVE